MRQRHARRKLIRIRTRGRTPRIHTNEAEDEKRRLPVAYYFKRGGKRHRRAKAIGREARRDTSRPSVSEQLRTRVESSMRAYAAGRTGEGSETAGDAALVEVGFRVQHAEELVRVLRRRIDSCSATSGTGEARTARRQDQTTYPTCDNCVASSCWNTGCVRSRREHELARALRLCGPRYVTEERVCLRSHSSRHWHRGMRSNIQPIPHMLICPTAAMSGSRYVPQGFLGF